MKTIKSGHVLQVHRRHISKTVVSAIFSAIGSNSMLCSRKKSSGRRVYDQRRDFLDRGPASWEVALFSAITANAHSVLGNHERRVAGTIRGTSGRRGPRRSQSPNLPGRSPRLADYLGRCGGHRDGACDRSCAAGSAQTQADLSRLNRLPPASLHSLVPVRGLLVQMRDCRRSPTSRDLSSPCVDRDSSCCPFAALYRTKHRQPSR